MEFTAVAVGRIGSNSCCQKSACLGFFALQTWASAAEKEVNVFAPTAANSNTTRENCNSQNTLHSTAHTAAYCYVLPTGGRMRRSALGTFFSCYASGFAHGMSLVIPSIICAQQAGWGTDCG